MKIGHYSKAMVNQLESFYICYVISVLFFAHLWPEPLLVVLEYTGRPHTAYLLKFICYTKYSHAPW